MSFDLKNKKLNKEWGKIKGSDIFPSFEAFAEFYYTNGEKTCFRINTNTPWSKENFFFGEYSELLIYYKTEHPQKYVGKKYHSLTILDVFWQSQNEKDVLYARCKCDCGNETTKPFEGITKGNTRTCGCRKHKRAISSKKAPPPKIIPISEELIDELWDYEKNDIDPKTVAFNSTQKYWWKNNHGNPFLLSPFVFTKTDTQSSFPEQAIFHHIKVHFNDAINKARYITKYGEVLEIDILIPTLNLGIEYDGLFWHKNKLDLDESKNKSLNDEGLYIIRVRENGLPNMSAFNGKVIIRKNPSNEKTIINCINDVVDILSRQFDSNIDYLSPTDYYDLKECLRKASEAPFLEETCLRSLWDRKKNGSFINEYIKLSSSLPYYFSCLKGKTFELTPTQIYNAVKKSPRSLDLCHNNCLQLCKRKRMCCPFKTSKICPDWNVCDDAWKSKSSEKRNTTIPAERDTIRNSSPNESETVLELPSAGPSEREDTTISYECEKRNYSSPYIYEEKAKNINAEFVCSSQGICQHCGGTFKRKYLIFGEYVCVKCGKKKDY